MHDILETMKAEIEEGIEVLRPYYSGCKEATLRTLAEYWRPHYYLKGHWPTVEKIEEKPRLAEEIEENQRRLAEEIEEKKRLTEEIEAEMAEAKKLETETV
jgi:hypothetical protein